ncbi:hypothetical protein BT63DRAFT_453706 [Microthyrium microscopicum]|uniref:Uncharacterized protein n=1 Tax=Microthyrium microscopicum TaxID=703497 RepID=A0A6A6UGA1_9PEZI|nr:hypothetical protein BT63DRAFT_453706 [Microthyrium microscopicum]
MDMDIDMDLGLDLETGNYMEQEQMDETYNGSHFQQQINLPEDPIAQEGGNAILDKLHVRGLDNLSSADVKRFAGEHYSLEEFERIEWIDDTSANLIYSTANAASEALEALTNSDLIHEDVRAIPSLQLRPARQLSSNPNSELFIRQASSIDVKKRGAYDASRYYLMNPDQDPRERKKMQEHRRPRERRGSDDDNYNRRRFDEREHKRRRDDAANGFDATMYDDDEGGNQTGYASDDRRKRARRNRGDDLFGDRSGNSGGRLRGRSASPLGEGDGMMGFGSDAENGSRVRRSRQRTRSPGRLPARKNLGKELFASKAGTTSTTKELFPDRVMETSPAVELFPEKTLKTPGMRSSMELFPNKRGSFSNHRRSNAVDASESAQAFKNSTSLPRDQRLSDNMSGRPSTAPDSGIQVRGAADSGISIRGMGHAPPTVRELFPLKAGSNLGKELFGQRRANPRRKAEDMF